MQRVPRSQTRFTVIWCLLEILETTRAFEELADLVEDAFDVGVVVVHPSDWGAVVNVRGGLVEARGLTVSVARARGRRADGSGST